MNPSLRCQKHPNRGKNENIDVVVGEIEIPQSNKQQLEIAKQQVLKQLQTDSK
jgi:hypothetical protein